MEGVVIRDAIGAVRVEGASKYHRIQWRIMGSGKSSIVSLDVQVFLQ